MKILNIRKTIRLDLEAIITVTWSLIVVLLVKSSPPAPIDDCHHQTDLKSVNIDWKNTTVSAKPTSMPRQKIAKLWIESLTWEVFPGTLGMKFHEILKGFFASALLEQTDWQLSFLMKRCRQIDKKPAWVIRFFPLF